MVLAIISGAAVPVLVYFSMNYTLLYFILGGMLVALCTGITGWSEAFFFHCCPCCITDKDEENR
jgi:VIT1/CCC1 family predicted Fe2+/Mn2+ transporter